MNIPKSPSPHIADDLLFEFLDQALSPKNFTEINTHLEICPTCQKRLVELRTMFVALEDLPDVDLQRDLSPTILETIKNKPMFSVIWWWSLILQAILALGLIAIIAPSIEFLENGKNVFATILAYFSNWLQQGMALFDNLQQFVGQLSSVRMPLSINLPTQNILLLLIFVSITWIVGNSILLRPVEIETQQ